MALSETGIAEACAVATRLAQEPLAAVYSSPRERTYRTAREIAEAHGLKVRIDDDLDELDFGDWAGLEFEELADDPLWARWNEARAAARPPDGESMDEAVDRADSALARMAAEHASSCVAAVTHCDVIRGVLARRLGLSFDHMLRFDVDPASVSRIAIGAGWSRVISINERSSR